MREMTDLKGCPSNRAVLAKVFHLRENVCCREVSTCERCPPEVAKLS